MGRRRGVAIFVVMSAVLVLGAFAAILWSSKSQSQAPLEQSFEKRQAEYLAKGAQQHALLKARLLPTELYDAISYSIGRNPYFDFGLGLKVQPSPSGPLDPQDADRNPGPMFYTGTVQEITLVDDPENPGPENKILRIRRTGVEDGSGANMGALREMFTFDVATLFPVPNLNSAVVVVDSRAHEDVAMGAGWQDPFVGNYKVQTLRILGLQGGRRYDKDTMMLTTIGSVKRAGQISIVTNLGGGPKNLSPIRRASSQVNPDAFGEYDTVFEDMGSHQQRVGDMSSGVDTNDVFGDSDPDDPNASGRRTEIATGVYYITRKAVDAPPP